MINFLFRAALLVLLFPSVLIAQEIPDHLYSKPNTPIVTVGGFINFNAAYIDQGPSYSNSRLPDSTVTNGLIDASNPGTYNSRSRKMVFSNDSEIYIKVGAISNTGLKYGAVVELEADVTNDGLNEGINADKSYIFTESRAGKFEFGNNSGVNQKMKVGPASFVRAAGGITGEYLQYINLPMMADETRVTTAANRVCTLGGTSADTCSGNFINTSNTGAHYKIPRFIVIPQAPIAHGGYAKSFIPSSDPEFRAATNPNGTTNTLSSTNGSFARNGNRNNFYDFNDGAFGQMEDATKISFYTPRIDNWQFGISYTPDTGDIGTTSSLSGVDTGDIENVVSVGLNYSNNVGNLGVAFSVTGEAGQFEATENTAFANAGTQINRNDLRAYDVGFMMTYFGFTVGGSYGNWGDSLQAKNGSQSCDYNPNVTFANQDCSTSNKGPGYGDAHYYTAGLAYEFGPIAFSVTHLTSKFQNNAYAATSLGFDYKLAKGLMPYIEVTQFAFESNQPRASDLVNQSNLPNEQRQLRDNEGYVGLVGILFSF